jgi:hypothetical protein
MSGGCFFTAHVMKSKEHFEWSDVYSLIHSECVDYMQ